MKKLLIIDSHSILYKSYFAFIKNPLRNSKGMNTSALFGFLRTYFSILQQFKPDYICFAFDKSRQTFRSELYPQYKAHRSETPDDLKEQFPYARKIAEAMKIKTLMIEGFEADDILGSLSHQLCSKYPDLNAYLITGDRDSFQLVNPQIFVGYSSSKARDGIELYGEQDIIQKYGLEPQSLIEVKALQGDTSDNIPGVRGVGEKTALKLVQDWGTLERLYENIDSIKGKLKEKLELDKDAAFISRTLAKIELNIDLELDIEQFEYPDHYDSEFRQILEELEFNSLIESLFGKVDSEKENIPKERTPPEYSLILTETDLQSLIKSLEAHQRIALDTETDSLDPYKAKLVGISVAWSELNAVYIPLGHSYLGCPKQLSYDQVLPAIQRLFSDPSKTWVGHNLKFDLAVLKKYGFNHPAQFRDTMIMGHLLYPEAQLGLKSLASKILGEERKGLKDILGKEGNFRQLDLKTACQYAAADAENTWSLFSVFETELETKPGLKNLAEKIEFPLVKVLEKMEAVGIKIDRNHFLKLSRELEKEATISQNKVFELAGEQFNLNSTKQLQKILIERLEIPLTRKTKTGFSTATDVLEELAPQYPICQLITEYRHLVKLLNTYTIPLQTQADSADFLHTSFQQTIVATGRLSSTSPNLQNIPVRSQWGQKIRKGFLPCQPDWKLISIDYSQIELRVLAHLCADDALISAFVNDRDIHRETAAKIFNKELTQVTKEERESAKAINFGIIYGISPFGLSRQLQISMIDAKKFIENYFLAFPKIKEFMDQTREEAIASGKIETVFGRVRPIEELKSKNKSLQEAGKRIAINSKIQGTAAELIKLAMISIAKFLEEKRLRSRLLLQVHDELILEVAPDEEIFVKDYKRIMENIYPMRVPLTCDVEIGKNWGSLEKLEINIS